MSAGSALLHAKNIVHALDIPEGAHVADLGAGRTGHFVFRLADAVGADGRVYAVDLHPEAVSMLGSYALLRQAHNVQTVWGDIARDGGVAIADGSLALALFVHTLSSLAERETAAREARRLVRPGGRIAVIDWLPEGHVLSWMASHVLTPEDADALFARAGCRRCAAFAPSPWHWGRVYTVQEA